MKNRYLLFLIIVFSCTGCHVDYYLDIDKNLHMKETVTLHGDSSSDIESIKDYDEYLPIDYYADEIGVFQKKIPSVEYYRISKKDDNSLMEFKYNDYDVDKLNSDVFAKNCFKYVTVMKKKYKGNRYGSLLISTSNQLLCMDTYDGLDSVDVTLYSKYKLIETNADEASERTYIWHFDQSNYQQKHIYLLLDINDRKLSFWEKFLEGEYFNAFTVITFLIIIGGIIFLILRRWGIYRNKV